MLLLADAIYFLFFFLFTSFNLYALLTYQYKGERLLFTACRKGQIWDSRCLPSYRLTYLHTYMHTCLLTYGPTHMFISLLYINYLFSCIFLYDIPTFMLPCTSSSSSSLTFNTYSIPTPTPILQTLDTPTLFISVPEMEKSATAICYLSAGLHDTI